MADKWTIGAVEDAIEAAKYEARQEGYAEGLKDGVAAERERCLAACQRVAQEYESAAASVGAFNTPREMAAQKCVSAIRAGEVRG